MMTLFHLKQTNKWAHRNFGAEEYNETNNKAQWREYQQWILSSKSKNLGTWKQVFQLSIEGEKKGKEWSKESLCGLWNIKQNIICIFRALER